MNNNAPAATEEEPESEVSSIAEGETETVVTPATEESTATEGTTETAPAEQPAESEFRLSYTQFDANIRSRHFFRARCRDY